MDYLPERLENPPIKMFDLLKDGLSDNIYKFLRCTCIFKPPEESKIDHY